MNGSSNIYDDLVISINKAAEALTELEFTSKQIREWIELNDAENWPIFSPSFQVNFSKAVNEDPQCIVERVPGKFLYKVTSITQAQGSDVLGTDATTYEKPADVKQQQREAKLYESLRNWMVSQGYEAETTAAKKKGGTWGNPDITGLKLEELPTGPVGFECSTIEAKLSLDNWRYFIFEAIAHKRFSHRAWFAFAVGSDAPELAQIKESKLLFEYAEKYRVGVVVVFVPSKKYEELTTGDANSLELGPDDVRVEVLWPAVYESVQTAALSEFMRDVLQISNQTDFNRFGRDN